MNDEENKLNAECSLCWKCRFGMCVKESETERVYHANMRGMMPPSQQMEDGFNLFADASFDDNNDEDDADLIEHTIEHERIKTICYWRPNGIENTPPIGVGMVHQCSRFEQK